MIEDISLRRYLGLDKGYDPNQLRDERGRWTTGGKSTRKKTRYKRQKRQYKTGYPPCGRTRLDSALSQSLSSFDEKGQEYTKYVIDYRVHFIYNDVLDYEILDWDFIKGTR